MKIKIAYLILCHKYPLQVAQLINKLYVKNQTFFFIHIDKTSKPNKLKNEIKKYTEVPNIIFLSNQVNVKWGGMSFLKAIELLMNEAFNHCSTIDYFCLLSVQCYPVKSNQEIFNLLSKNIGKSFIEIYPYITDTSKPNRLNRYYLYDFFSKAFNKNTVRNLIFRGFTKVLGKRNVPFTPYWGRVWWILYRDHVHYIIKNMTNKNKIYNHMKFTLLPEEIFFASILAESPHRKSIVSKRTTFADYSGPHPRLIEHSEIKSLVKSDFFFARKFEENSDIIKQLNKLIQE
ncbi:beta-1,6-N-acetylglucosaminyltransferase [Thermophagus xiamenensis]|uniref:Peptide O-xylosyltransferase n=1 Tax=Thermophagus xiamenensis TaxID=385682 RepID=A0A1I2G2Y2_9BACT|nr:beta-1,6-N-acetylglucosaminyltransferase [Thermophagus xiamenensis]SFF11001.1 Core-2/I-Branching enzyme [Thermophagus xiamenensis]